MAKTLNFTLLFTLSFVISTNFVQAQGTVKNSRIKTIIVDAGHGGSDPGARGSYSTEAEITLQLATKVDNLLRQELPDTRIVMTRTTDVYHSPREKANIANKENGDLFVCIHVNAAPPRKEVTGYKSVAYYKGKGSNRKKYYIKYPSTGRFPIQLKVHLPMFGRLTELTRKPGVLLRMSDLNLLPK